MNFFLNLLKAKKRNEIRGGKLWEVTSQPQVMLGDRTLAFNADQPVQVDVRVREAHGIHDELVMT